jgi:hypothetical protein
MTTQPLPNLPAQSTVLPADIASAGPAIPAIERLRIMSPAEWVDFILEWAHSLKSKYQLVEKCDGAGDMGRDIVAFQTSGQTDSWDNYQCKHYDHPLIPIDVWCELGKLCYYTYVGEYTLPRAYYFVSPQGAGNKLSKLLRSPKLLKQELLAVWDDKCKTSITSIREIPLDAPLRAHIDALDLSRIHTLSPLTIIEEHRRTPWHAARFGGGLPVRPPIPAPPPTVAIHETQYIRALLDAYEDRLKCQIASMAHLTDAPLTEHLHRSRREFYCAESLREFSKDNVPPGTFDGLLDEVYSGVIDVVQASHPDAVERVLATVKQAKALSLASNALVTRVTTSDKGGMCHQLANDNTNVKWRP